MPIDHTPFCGFGLARWCPSLPARRSTRASRDLRPMLRPPTVEWGGAIREGGGKRNLLRTPSSAATSCATARQVQPRISFSMCLIPWSPHVSHAVRHFPFHKQRGDPCPFFFIFHTPSYFSISHAGRPDAPEQRDARRVYKVYALRDAMAVAAV